MKQEFSRNGAGSTIGPKGAPFLAYFARSGRFPLGPIPFFSRALRVCVQSRVMRYRGREAAPRKRFEIDDGFSRWGTLRVTSKRFFRSPRSQAPHFQKSFSASSDVQDEALMLQRWSSKIARNCSLRKRMRDSPQQGVGEPHPAFERGIPNLRVRNQPFAWGRGGDLRFSSSLAVHRSL